jgi:hypothetical protein
MSKRLRERVQVGVDSSGKAVYKWATGYTTTELQIDIARILVEAGVLNGIMPSVQEKNNSRKTSTDEHSK